MSNRQLDFVLSLKDQFSAQWQKTMGQASASLAKMKIQLDQVKGWIGAAFSVAALKNFVDEAMEASKANGALEASLVRMGAASRTTEFEKFGEDLQKLTPYSDEAIKNVENIILSMTRNTEAVKPLTKATLDLSTVLGISAEAAARLFSKTAEGSKGLARLGIDIGKTSSESERLAKIVAEVEKRFGGAAEAAGKTTAGQMKILQNQIGELKESFGFIILDALRPFIGILKTAVDWLNAAPTSIKAMVLAVGLLTAAFYALNIPMAGLPLIIGGIVTGLVGLVAMFGGVSTSIDNAKKGMADFKQELSALDAIDTLASTYETLSAKVKLSDTDHKTLAATIQQLAEFMPSAVTGWNNEGKALGINTAAIRDNADARRQLLLIKEHDFIKKEVINPLTEAVAKYTEYGNAIAKAQGTLSTAKSDLVAAETGYAKVSRSVGELKNQINLSSSFLRDNSTAMDETKSHMTDLVSVLSLYVKNVKDFETVAPVLKSMGLDAATIDLLKNKWNELTVAMGAIGNVKPPIDTTEIKAAAGSITALSKTYEDLAKKLKDMAPNGSTAFFVVKQQAEDALIKLRQAEIQYDRFIGKFTSAELAPKVFALDIKDFKLPELKPIEVPVTFTIPKINPATTKEFQDAFKIAPGLLTNLNAQLAQAVDKQRLIAEYGQAWYDRLKTVELEYTVISDATFALMDTLRSNFSQAWNDIFGEANSLLEQFFQRFTSMLLDDLLAKFEAKLLDIVGKALAKSALSKIPIIGDILGFLFHQGGTVPKAHTGAFVDPNGALKNLGGIQDAMKGITFNVPASKEFPILVRGGETIRTELQEKEVQRLIRDAQAIINAMPQAHTGGTVDGGRRTDLVGRPSSVIGQSVQTIDNRKIDNHVEHHNQINMTLEFQGDTINPDFIVGQLKEAVTRANMTIDKLVIGKNKLTYRT